MNDQEPGWPQHVLTEACKLIGLDPTGARLIKFTNNAVFELQAAPVIVRIAGSASIGERAHKVVAVAEWLEEHRMPAVRLLTGLAQPLMVQSHPVTFWHRAAPAAETPTGHDLGRILRQFHALPPPAISLPLWQPLNAIRSRVAAETFLSAEDHAFLVSTCDELEAALAEISYVLPAGPIHGDSFMGNLIPSLQGPVICDFDSAAFGPREWDLTPVAVGKLRFDYPDDVHSEVAATYGTDILRWPHFDVFRELRELQLVTSVLPVLTSNPKLQTQWAYRFKSFKEGDLNAVWTTYT